MKRNYMNRIVSALLVLVLTFATPAFAAGDTASAKASSATVVIRGNSATLIPGEAMQLYATVNDVVKKATWKSSNTSIATVNSNGLVMAKRKGSVKITATIKSSGKKAKVVLTVSTAFDGVNVHFYGIGNENYIDGLLPGCAADLASMAGLYDSASYGGKRPAVYTYLDRTGAGIRAVLSGMVNNPDIDEDDITIFYYSGHGYQGSTQPMYNGALCGVDLVDSASQLVTVDEVQRYLDQVPGNVVVIIDSCFSGQFIKNKGIFSTAKVTEATLKAANAAWINKLSASRATNYNAKALTNSAYRTKYRIITAASNAQESASMYEVDDDGNILDAYGLFTYVFTGYLYEMDADTNKDKIINLHEAYTKVSAYIESFRKDWNRQSRDKLYQVTQVWPSKNAFPIYARN